MNKVKIGIIVVLIAILGAGVYFYYKPKPAADPELAQIQNEIKDAMRDDYEELKKEFESSSDNKKSLPPVNSAVKKPINQATSNSNSTSNATSTSEPSQYVPSKDKFYKTPEGAFVTDFFNELIKGVSYRQLGSTDDFTFSDQLLDVYFDRNSPKHPGGTDDRWLYAKGVEPLVKSFLSQGPAEIVGHPLLHEFQNINNGTVLKGTVLIRSGSSNKYQGLRYYMFLNKKANDFVVSETDFNLELIDISASELNRYIDIFKQG